MADALISVVLEQLALPLHDKLKKEINLVLGAPEDVKKLHETLNEISYVLDDAEKRHIQNVLHNMEKRENRKAPESSWLEKLKDIFYQMEEVLDEWHTELRKLEVVAASDSVDAADKDKKTKAWACFMPPCSCFKKVTFHHKIGSRILELKQQFDLLITEKDKYDFKKSRREEEKHVQLEEDERRSISKISTSNVYGRVAEKRKLINMLLAKSSQVNTSVPVISIVGMGGIGKTTLAQYIFNDDKVKNHFQNKMWVCVSESFDRIRLAKAIIEAAEGVVPNVNEWEAWHTQLCQSLEGKRFLLVLDDVWIENQRIWNELKCALDHGQIGSKILVTTRNVSVADTVGTFYKDKYILGKLSDDECWSLFERLALAKKEESDYQVLKDVGRKISNKCKGVPLYANTLGSLMARKRRLEDWEEVLVSDIWNLPNVNKYILAPLLLSYNALPSNLKRCFTYCAVFPKDTIIYKDTLIKLWMAEGCLGSSQEKKLESIGEKYFDELVMRSFFQELQLDEYDEVSSCKMHDLLHDLASFLSTNECLVDEPKGISLNNTMPRHLCVQRSIDQMDGSLNSIWRLKSLRTLLAGRRYDDSSLQDWAQLSNLTCLRTLDLSEASISELPKEVEKLIHLRYLNLSLCEQIKELPETITNLINLQTLDLNSCYSLSGLPNSFGKLVSLRHLHIYGCYEFKGLPRGIGKLRDLRTLSEFIVSEEGCDLGELKDLNNLCGSLYIRYIRGIGNEAQGVMNNNKNLHKLYLEFSFGSEDDDLKALELLEPHSDLKELEIMCYKGSKFPSWMKSLGTSQKPIMLRQLTIRHCYNLKVLPALAELQFLEYLKLDHCNSVASMGLEVLGLLGDAVGVSVKMSASNIAFSKLKELQIYKMSKWEELVIDTTSMNITLMPCLQILNVVKCPMLKSLPCQLLSSFSLREIRIDDCPYLVVSSLPLFLEELSLQRDAGSLSKSLPVESGPHRNLVSLSICESSHPTIPQGVSQLTALQTLEIQRSPILAARCKKEQGEDWNFISHIPNILILN